jgi:hypothetical protein
MYRLFGCLICCLGLAAIAFAEELNQFSLMSQLDWAAKRGVFVILDNRYAGSPSKLENLRLTIADLKEAHARFHPREKA